jgi:hypothetical protein
MGADVASLNNDRARMARTSAPRAVKLPTISPSLGASADRSMFLRRIAFAALCAEIAHRRGTALAGCD